MSDIKFYPLGNADCCLITTSTGHLFAFDYADMNSTGETGDPRMPLESNFKEDIGWPDRDNIDVLAITHGDNDHVKGISDTFWLKHAEKYQNSSRIKINELWVPAALIVEVGSKDYTQVVRAEARHRFLAKDGIRVFGRPEHLKVWLESNGKKIEDYLDIICDAGKCVSGYSQSTHGVEFFVHSPFAERTDDCLLQRNENCLVMQANLLIGNRNTRFLITADSASACWVKIVNITRAKKNDHRLEWDVFKIPHHCSYLSMSEEKGSKKTIPTKQFQWLLAQGAQRSIIVSTSDPIPSETTIQPPHVETFRVYQDASDALDADLVVTMEMPNKKSPKRTVISLTTLGPKLIKAAPAAAAIITSKPSPRVG